MTSSECPRCGHLVLQAVGICPHCFTSWAQNPNTAGFDRPVEPDDPAANQSLAPDADRSADGSQVEPSAEPAKQWRPITPQPTPTKPAPRRRSKPDRGKRRLRWPAVVVIVLVVAGLVTSGSMVALNFRADGLSKQDYYQVGPETVPSVKQALGAERKVVWSSEDSRAGIEQIVVAYEPSPDDPREWSKYVEYLQANQGFTQEWATAPESASGSVVVAKPSQQAPYRLYVRLDWGETEYVVTVMRAAGVV